ncbi:MAG: stage V sporulation protein AD [Oscillospiraceae bacterium]|jgi:stage V sporulation protein AD|nr:stage V sporulation protein AD [Oscillospiraceae bacterium]
MSEIRLGAQTIRFDRPPRVLGCASVVGKKEGAGPLGGSFDVVETDAFCGEKTWEKAESRLLRTALARAAEKAGQPLEELDILFAGDLLDQCIGTSFGLRGTKRPLLGLYAACATMAEGLILAAAAVSAGYARTAAAMSSSHFCAAERQYRLPLEYGGQRTPTAQWTVTGAGALVLGTDSSGPSLTHAAVGRIVDAGVKDPAHMGAAMAPAAYDTLRAFFAESGTAPEAYDLIATGDLGAPGSELLLDLFARDGVALAGRHVDCGTLIYDANQDTHAGGSGAGCGAVVLCGHLMRGLQERRWRRLLFCGTGALLSPVSAAQGESIPAICHVAAFSG